MTIVGDHGRPFFRHVFDDFEVFDYLDGPRGARMALGERFGRVLGGLEGIRGSSGRCWSGLGGHLAARRFFMDFWFDFGVGLGAQKGPKREPKRDQERAKIEGKNDVEKRSFYKQTHASVLNMGA